MLRTTIKEGFRLNRSVGLALLFYSGLLLVRYCLFHQGLFYQGRFLFGQPDLYLTLAGGVVALFFFCVNEWCLRRLQIRKSLGEEYTEKNLTVFQQIKMSSLVLSTFTVSVMYLLTGDLCVILLGIVPVLEAQLFGLTLSVKILTGVLLLIYSAGFLLGYPKHLAVFEATNIWFLLSGLPLILVLMHFSSIAAMLFHQHNNKIFALQSLALTDTLTQLANRRQFNRLLNTEFSRYKRYGSPLVLALFDIDNFKTINDHYGHPTGDRILQSLGKLVSENIRESDIAARYGGEEFAVILPETRQADAIELLERLRVLIANSVFCLPDLPLTLTVSIGLCSVYAQHNSSFELVKQADAMLYEAKRQGKNRVIADEEPSFQPSPALGTSELNATCLKP